MYQANQLKGSAFRVLKTDVVTSLLSLNKLPKITCFIDEINRFSNLLMGASVIEKYMDKSEVNELNKAVSVCDQRQAVQLICNTIEKKDLIPNSGMYDVDQMQEELSEGSIFYYSLGFDFYNEGVDSNFFIINVILALLDSDDGLRKDAAEKVAEHTTINLSKDAIDIEWNTFFKKLEKIKLKKGWEILPYAIKRVLRQTGYEMLDYTDEELSGYGQTDGWDKFDDISQFWLEIRGQEDTFCKFLRRCEKSQLSSLKYLLKIVNEIKREVKDDELHGHNKKGSK